MPSRAKACPECGSCPETGWSEAARYDSLDLPDREFDYEDFVAREFGSGRAKPRGLAWGWWGVAIVTLLGFLYFVLR